MIQFLKHGVQRLRDFLPALAFLGGFVWDALTIGRKVSYLDLWLLFAYLLVAAGLLWWIGHRHEVLRYKLDATHTPNTPPSERPLRARIPFLLLQFLFGGLLSALCIFYFKSANHTLAWLLTLLLAFVLVANEWMDDFYHQFTLTWTLFGLCAMLLLNFLLPYMLGSIASVWFYLSTLLGAGATHFLRTHTPGVPGRIAGVWGMALLLMLAYPLDVIPPVPLVKQDIQVGLFLQRGEGDYQLRVVKAPWWAFWHAVEARVPVERGDRLYCVSAVFAPKGLHARLIHHWQYYDPHQGWQSRSRIGFTLSGGRDNGFRGYSYKQNIQAGEWRVILETEGGRTLGTHHFQVTTSPVDEGQWMVYRF